MNNILDYMDTLNEIDTENVEELYNVHDMNNSLREDNYESSLDKKMCWQIVQILILIILKFP
ncbi:MAG: hypothetical protein CM15mP33_09980 [Candidatus Neomarinimicrobiota bacterium]|nr:MAG: hypothetical protein CM15mP33_09980 [Candidatus Neomarinimicrobiota bacterium]